MSLNNYTSMCEFIDHNVLGYMKVQGFGLLSLFANDDVASRKSQMGLLDSRQT